MTAIYEFRDVGKRFSGPEHLEIFKNISFTVEEGESLAIVGTSGSGKSTLLHLMGALDTPTDGAVLFEGRDLASLTPDETAHFRNTALGFVFHDRDGVGNPFKTTFAYIEAAKRLGVSFFKFVEVGNFFPD